jgi:hypothetical protein
VFLFPWGSVEEGGGAVVESMTSAAAFVEGGVQDACDDACSICLESFCDEDPATVTPEPFFFFLVVVAVVAAAFVYLLFAVVPRYWNSVVCLISVLSCFTSCYFSVDQFA